MQEQPADHHSMTCMEIWGGNRATSRSISLPGLEVWIQSRPYQEADSGGDVYYVSNCATGRITRLLVADVSGHGAAVAETAHRLRLLMRRYVNHIQQFKFVSSMNDEFASVSHAGRFATAVVATFLATNRCLTFTNAGHPNPFYFSASNRTWHKLEISNQTSTTGGPTDLPLGMYEQGTYIEQQLELRPGDLVLFYTDAFIESRTADDELLGVDAFLKLVSSLDPTIPQSLTEQIHDAVKGLNPRNLLDDDSTLLLFQATGQSSVVPFKNRVLAPFRLLAGLGAALLNGGRGMPLPEFSLANLGIGLKRPVADRAGATPDAPPSGPVVKGP